MGFKNVKERLRKFGLEILGLLEESFISIAVDLKNHDRVAKYYTVEREYPHRLYQILLENPDILKQNRSYSRIDKNLVVLVPMKSVGIQDVGVIAMRMDTEEPKNNTYIYQTTDTIRPSNHIHAYPKREIIIK